MKAIIKVAAVVATFGLFLGGTAQGAVLAPVQVFVDESLDTFTDPDVNIAAQDLVSGSIAETDTSIDFTWQVVDTPDETAALGGIPEAVVFFWEFSLDVAGDDKDPAKYSLRARAPTPGGARGTGGSLQGNCVTTGSLVQCSAVPGNIVTVTTDPIANTITASVRRSDLKAGAGGTDVAVDGAVMIEEVLFRGIASFVSVGVSSSATEDAADMENPYVLGSPRA